MGNGRPDPGHSGHSAGRIEAGNAAGNRFKADSLSVGFDYLFSLPTW